MRRKHEIRVDYIEYDDVNGNHDHLILNYGNNNMIRKFVTEVIQEVCNESLNDYNDNVCAIVVNIVIKEEDVAMAKWMSIYYNGNLEKKEKRYYPWDGRKRCINMVGCSIELKEAILQTIPF